MYSDISYLIKLKYFYIILNELIVFIINIHNITLPTI